MVGGLQVGDLPSSDRVPERAGSEPARMRLGKRCERVLNLFRGVQPAEAQPGLNLELEGEQQEGKRCKHAGIAGQSCIQRRGTPSRDRPIPGCTCRLEVFHPSSPWAKAQGGSHLTQVETQGRVVG